jgi:zinc/manganese transport system substrate-binding protein
MKKFFITICLIFNTIFLFSELKVVTTLSFLGDIVSQIGKDKVKVETLIDGKQDPHFIEPRPSMVIKMRDADMVVKIGMALDMWVDSIIDASRNKKVMFGQKGYLDVSVGIEKLDKIEGKVDGRLGDVHPQGNPHYWLDPENIKIIAKNVAYKLSELSPENKEYFEKNLEQYLNLLNIKISQWKEKLSSLNEKNIVIYHRSWNYFAKRFNLNIIAELEPLPGIPPSASHLSEVVNIIKQNKVKFILKETFYPNKPAQFVSQQTGVKIVNVPNDVGGTNGVNSYLDLMDYIVNKILETAS